MADKAKTPEAPQFDPAQAVRNRYSAAAKQREAALCCPVDYETRYLEALPEEVIERDYGCGDPSRHVREGDTALDLGSGGGKICFIAAQIVGPKGSVIGVDTNDEMLELARRSAPLVSDRLGYANVHFRRGQIQDLALDEDRLDEWLQRNPVSTVGNLSDLDEEKERLRRAEPMIPDKSVDIVISNCVLNLVRDRDKSQLIREIFRVLKVGGRIAISDIVSDKTVPAELRDDPMLWSGCISGAFHEEQLFSEFEAAGFCGLVIDKWEPEPFAVVKDIEFRSLTLTAIKNQKEPATEANQTVVYRGPWKRVEDDEGRALERGARTAVGQETFRMLTQAPYAEHVVAIEPGTPISESERTQFDRDGRGCC